MSPRFDVLVVGGGPAGSSVAAMAAAAGARTVLIERSRFPRDKVCGEFVSAEGCGVLRRLGVLGKLVGEGARWMDACRITDRAGVALDLPLPRLREGREALGISRERMDLALLDLAAARGAVVRPRCEAVEPLLRDGTVRGFSVRRVGSESRETLEASLVVAADGRRSVLARALHPRRCDPARSGPRSWFGLKLHVERTGSAPADRVELHLFDGGYVGISPVEGDRTNVCLMTTVRALRACGGSPDRLLRERVAANPTARSALGEVRARGRWQSIGPLRFRVRRPAASGALFVGDAAGTIDPFCGEGMTHALLGAEIALPYVLEAVADGGLSGVQARRYERAWRKAFAPVTRRVRCVGALLERPAVAEPLLGLLGGAARGLAPRLIAATRTGRSA